MKPFTIPGRKRAVIVAVTMLAAVSLTACGGDGDDYRAPDAPVPAPTPAPTPTPMVDAFFAAVSALIGASAEDTEPSATVEAIVATSPEDTEPQPVS
ncbi:hypothetical protein [Massilia sp. TWR1-2-2]|uniref:hypothetical protein n=1 Tax=Massilia sp. TWR1-2-2 TaxID=2804584 RepID=UPI003CE92C5C